MAFLFLIVIIEPQRGAVIGSTGFANILPAHRRLEIGWTWVIPPDQKTSASTEAKLLLLTHPSRLGAMRVELKTDALNAKSQRAILRIGAKKEDTLRWHMATDTGRRLRKDCNKFHRGSREIGRDFLSHRCSYRRGSYKR